MGNLPICDCFWPTHPPLPKTAIREAIPPAKSAEGSFDAPQASHGREKVTSATFHLKWNAFLDKIPMTSNVEASRAWRGFFSNEQQCKCRT